MNITVLSAYNYLSAFSSYQHTVMPSSDFSVQKRPNNHTANYALQDKLIKQHNITVTLTSIRSF